MDIVINATFAGAVIVCIPLYSSRAAVESNAAIPISGAIVILAHNGIVFRTALGVGGNNMSLVFGPIFGPVVYITFGWLVMI